MRPQFLGVALDSLFGVVREGLGEVVPVLDRNLNSRTVLDGCHDMLRNWGAPLRHYSGIGCEVEGVATKPQPKQKQIVRNLLFYIRKIGRGERIRTSGLHVPNVALYQAKLHPELV